MGLINWLREAFASRPSVVERRYAELRSSISALSLEDAEDQVNNWLASGAENAETVGETVEPELFAALAPSAQRLLARFGRIEVGGAMVGGAIVAFENTQRDQIRIGEDLEDARIFVLPNEEPVWVFEPEESGELAWPDPYPSLAHYLLIVRATTDKGWFKVRE